MNKISLYPDDDSFKAAYRAGYLIAAYIQQKLTPAEREELDSWIEAAPENLALFEELIDEKNTKQSLQWFKQLDTQRAKRRLHQKIALSPERPLFLRWQPYLVAASILLLAGTGAWYLTRQSADRPVVIKEQTGALPPGGGQVTLTLENGRTIALDTALNGTLAREGRVAIKKADHALSYQAQGPATPSAALYHTLSVPKGGQYRIELADGTRVWLNAASRLHFPPAFVGAERRVQLEGEAYFEVAKKASMPFHVEAGGADIAVLGTHFNVRSYAGASLQTTLLEGSVAVSTDKKAVRLTPGEQALLSTTGTGAIRVEKNIDLGKVTGWKNGLFIFRNDSLATIMNELQRWYDITVEGAHISSYHYTGTFQRSTSLDKVLHYLEGTGQVRFRIEGKKVRIYPGDSHLR